MEHPTPRIFISHGTRDEVLPIDPCSRRLVPLLKNHDLPIVYREFDGAHTIPEMIRQQAIDWFLS